MPDADPYELQRFLDAQAGVYDQALDELHRGRKTSHWMWFIFPQLRGLGFSKTARFYGIASRDEAAAWLAHPVLGARLLACTGAVLAITGRSAAAVFGHPDDLKLRSSMTLFDQVQGGENPFAQVLAHWYDGQPDAQTLALLAQMSPLQQPF